ncbi:MAG: rare lipoprotein [Pseudomonadota bacterium]|nr:rare lipoprotein [Pseudomonadota bacterium]
MNERNEPRFQARFPRSRVAGFPPIALMIALALSIGLPTTADAGGKEGKKPAHAAKVTGGQQVGKASWYGPGFHGKRTASGQRFDQHALTAAHPRLPLGSRAKITNLRNGKVVEVTINDRGPHGGGRIIDLSRAAAQRLAMDGVARVSIVAITD